MGDVGGVWEAFANDVDWIVWNAAFETVVLIQGEETAVWQDWESGAVFGRYSTTPFWTVPTPISPSGEYVILIGNQPSQSVYALFLLARSQSE